MSGDNGRDFAQVMFDFGVAIVGDGNSGNLKENLDKYRNEKTSWKKVNWLLSIKKGDRIVLHNNRSTIQAVGEVYTVADEVYHYSQVFADVDGWDLQHFCHVRWKKINIKLNGNFLIRGTVSRLKHQDVINEIENIWSSYSFESPPYKIEKTNIDNLLTEEAIAGELIDKGLRIEDADQTVKTLAHIRKLGAWYLSKGSGIASSEHEIRSFIVIPLFKALGWSYQRMAVEYSNTDILLFHDSERKSAKILVETKSLWTGSSKSRRQATNYLQNPKKQNILKNVEWVLLTDGIVYWLYKRDNMEMPYAYMSLKRNQLFNPAYPQCAGALDLIKNLIP